MIENREYYSLAENEIKILDHILSIISANIFKDDLDIFNDYNFKCIINTELLFNSKEIKTLNNLNNKLGIKSDNIKNILENENE